MEFEEMKIYNLEHPVDGWGAKKVDEFLLKSDVDEFASEQQLFYNDLEKRMGKTIAEKESRIKELEADNEAVKYAALCHCDENDWLNKQLEDAENTYYAIKGELDNANKRIKELEANEQVLNDAHCKLMDKVDAAKPKWISVKDRMPNEEDEGTEFLVTNGVLCVVCEWRGYWNNDPFCGDKVCDEVTHWMPLPPPPTEESTATEKEDA